MSPTLIYYSIRQILYHTVKPRLQDIRQGVPEYVKEKLHQYYENKEKQPERRRIKWDETLSEFYSFTFLCVRHNILCEYTILTESRISYFKYTGSLTLLIISYWPLCESTRSVTSWKSS